jgi:transcription factor C subunit 3
MSPMVYSALQIITRGRDEGVSVVELGQKSQYDQKTCFYLVRQLTELDLVYGFSSLLSVDSYNPFSVKVRRGGVGSHFCIHKYFFDRSESWKAIRDEEMRAAAEVEAPSRASRATSATAGQEEDGPPEIPGLHFTPIDARHLSSMPLVKARIIKLLKASKNLMHASNNMLVALVRIVFLTLSAPSDINLSGFRPSYQNRSPFLCFPHARAS